MAETTITNRKFAQDMRAAQRAASEGPVVITDRGRPVHVLLSYEEYRRLRRDEPSIADVLGMPEAEDIEFDPDEEKQPQPSLADLLFDPEGQDIDFDPPKLNLVLKPVDFD